MARTDIAGMMLTQTIPLAITPRLPTNAIDQAPLPPLLAQPNEFKAARPEQPDVLRYDQPHVLDPADQPRDRSTGISQVKVLANHPGKFSPRAHPGSQRLHQVEKSVIFIIHDIYYSYAAGLSGQKIILRQLQLMPGGIKWINLMPVIVSGLLAP